MDSIALRRLLLICLGTLCIAGIAYPYRHPHASASSPEKTLSASPQFEALVARLNAAIVPDGAKTRRSCTLMPVYDATGDVNMTCSVECADEYGQTLFNVFWNEQTGSYQISFQPPIRKARSQRHLADAGAAEAAAWEWMDDLGIRQESDRWRVSSLPERANACWLVTLRSPDREVQLTIMAATGEITRANVNVLGAGFRQSGPAVDPVSRR